MTLDEGKSRNGNVSQNWEPGSPRKTFKEYNLSKMPPLFPDLEGFEMREPLF